MHGEGKEKVNSCVAVEQGPSVRFHAHRNQSTDIATAGSLTGSFLCPSTHAPAENVDKGMFSPGTAGGETAASAKGTFSG